MAAEASISKRQLYNSAAQYTACTAAGNNCVRGNGWLVGWMFGGLVGRLVDWLVGW